MPNLINTDTAGNTFYNYITPTIKGESSLPTSIDYSSILTPAIGSSNFAKFTSFGFPDLGYYLRFPAAPETKTGTVTSGESTWRFAIVNTGNNHRISTGLAGNTAVTSMGGNLVSTIYSFGKSFAVVNQHSFVTAIFDTELTTLRYFLYAGFLREFVYSGSVYPLGACIVNVTPAIAANYRRVNIVGGTTTSILSTAANSITSPPIVCTPGTDPGDDSETWTDIVIRDEASPNNPVGKLWNCVDMPASYTVGGLYKNVGAYDADGSSSAQDVYLCIETWGTRKLGMRVWTENV